MAWRQFKYLRYIYIYIYIISHTFKYKIKIYEIKIRDIETKLSYIMFIKTNKQLVCVGNS